MPRCLVYFSRWFWVTKAFFTQLKNELPTLSSFVCWRRKQDCQNCKPASTVVDSLICARDTEIRGAHWGRVCLWGRLWRRREGAGEGGFLWEADLVFLEKQKPLLWDGRHWDAQVCGKIRESGSAKWCSSTWELSRQTLGDSAGGRAGDADPWRRFRSRDPFVWEGRCSLFQQERARTRERVRTAVKGLRWEDWGAGEPLKWECLNSEVGRCRHRSLPETARKVRRPSV